MQVIDSKGMVVGNVKDISVDFHEKTLAFLVTTKNRTDLDVPWEDVLSIEDVVLMKTEIALPKIADAETASPTLGQAMIICPNCGDLESISNPRCEQRWPVLVLSSEAR